jgi:hypothetical protein
VEEAIALATRALAAVPHDDGPCTGAALHAQLAQLHASLGRHDEAVGHAHLAIPVLERLGAAEDTVQLLGVVASHAIVQGRFDEAERIFAAIDTGRRPGFGSGVLRSIGRAEVALARGRPVDGLRRYRDAVGEARDVRFPGFGEVNGLEPWTLFTESAALVAHARHGEEDDGADLEAVLRAKALALVGTRRPHLDHPILGVVVYALGMWALHRAASPGPAAVRLVALAERLAYPRSVPTMAWAHAVDAAERIAPGLLGQVLAGYGARRGPDLVAEVGDALRAASD